MKKSGPIAILCHWRCGSTLFRNILSNCGMVDMKKENPQLSNIDILGTDIYYNGINPQYNLNVWKEKVGSTLFEFKQIAEQNKHRHYGVKINHALQAPVWGHISSYFYKVWDDARYVISIRSPYDIINSINKLRKERGQLNPELSVSDILKSWKSTEEATFELIDNHKAEIIVFPDDHINGKVKKIINKLGMRWNQKANIFNESIPETLPKEERNAIANKYPDVMDLFEKIKAKQK